MTEPSAMTGPGAMAGLNSVVRTLTGPRRLRSALRQKTAPITRLLDGFASPTELCVRIPASVFGGDIFEIMSRQLREALIAPPATAPAISQPRRKHSLPSITNPLAKHSENFLPLADWLKQSTLSGETLAAISKKALPVNQNTTPQNPGISPLGPQASRLPGSESSPWRFLAGETPAVPGKSTTGPPGSSTSKQVSTTPALVSSLKRYWESTNEQRPTSRLPADRALPAPFASAVDSPVSEPDQRTASASRAWPNFVGRDVSEKLRSFTNGTNPLQKSARLGSQPDRQIQNVFNIEVNHANQHSSNFDDLGDRIAQILHEQALQHGIDVT